MSTNVTRLRPPNRRGSRTVKIRYADLSGLRLDAHVTYSRFDEAGTDHGRIFEVFVTASTPGSAAEAAMRDAGLVLSLALQHGCTLQLIAQSLTRGERGEPAGPVGVVVDALMEEERLYAEHK